MDELRQHEAWRLFADSEYQDCYKFIDLTTDIGLPCILGLRISADEKCAAVVSACSASLNGIDAMLKVIRDLSGCLRLFRKDRQFPPTWNEFSAIYHGAAYMARPECILNCAFLWNSHSRTKLSKMHAPFALADTPANLHALVSHLALKGHSAYGLDLTTDLARTHQVVVGRAIVPTLLPLPYHYRARYLGTKRLFEREAVGHHVRTEEELNPWPIPFA
jgi:ribosomal protein S12 methylthiotransferase accessory factor